MLFNEEGKQVTLRKGASDVERAAVREVLEVSMTDAAPKGMFSIEQRAKLRSTNGKHKA